jgi:hypothetical protein
LIIEISTTRSFAGSVPVVSVSKKISGRLSLATKSAKRGAEFLDGREGHAWARHKSGWVIPGPERSRYACA